MYTSNLMAAHGTFVRTQYGVFLFILVFLFSEREQSYESY